MNTYFLLVTCAVALVCVSSVEGACPMGTWGAACDAPCHCFYNSECDKDTGVCLAGCAKGWKSADVKNQPCDALECSEGTFGPPECKAKCHCAEGDVCNSVDGRCQGFECEKGFWGPNCQENVTACNACNITDANCVPCSMNSCWCDDPDCDVPEGQCRLTKCPDGFRGPECQERACGMGFFEPPECTSECHCFDGRSCNAVDGKCPDDHCEEGWRGPTCSQPGCSVMKFGYPECDHNCFCVGPVEDGEGVQCNDRTGQCPKGCVTGWSGSSCSERGCPDGLWGEPNCTEQCHCEDNSGCNPQTGKCEFGKCQEGWGHYLCDNKWQQTSEDWETSGIGLQLFGGVSVLCAVLVISGGVFNYMSTKKATTRMTKIEEEEIEMGERFLEDETKPGPSGANVTSLLV